MSRVGKMCEAKGRKAGWYKTLAVVLWFIGEGVGIAIGIMTASTEGVVYLYAIIGALVGGGLALLIVYRLENRTPTNIHFPASPEGYRLNNDTFLKRLFDARGRSTRSQFAVAFFGCLAVATVLWFLLRTIVPLEEKVLDAIVLPPYWFSSSPCPSGLQLSVAFTTEGIQFSTFGCS